MGDAFAARGANKSVNANSQQASEAVEIFQKAYSSKRRSPINENLLKTNFDYLTTIVGGDDALKIVETDPKVLEFNGGNFDAVYATYVSNLGEEDSLGMVMRNPALLCVPPTGYGGADTAGKDAFYLSYFIAATRPLGGVWLSVLCFLLATPLIEQITGVPLRSTF